MRVNRFIWKSYGTTVLVRVALEKNVECPESPRFSSSSGPRRAALEEAFSQLSSKRGNNPPGACSSNDRNITALIVSVSAVPPNLQTLDTLSAISFLWFGIVFLLALPDRGTRTEHLTNSSTKLTKPRPRVHTLSLISPTLKQKRQQSPRALAHQTIATLIGSVPSLHTFKLYTLSAFASCRLL